MTDDLPTSFDATRTTAEHIADHEELHRLQNIFKDSDTDSFEPAGSVATLDSQLGTASRARTIDLNATAAAYASAALDAAKAYADALVASIGTPSATAPAAPTIGTATPGTGQISIAFTPGSDGGSTILDYTATATSSDGGVTGTATGSGTPIVIPGLTPSAHYTVTVVARNAVGTSSASSASSSVQVNAASGSTVNRNRPFSDTSPFNVETTGSETTVDEKLFRFGGYTSPLSSAITASTPGVGVALPVTNAAQFPAYYYGNRQPCPVLVDSEEILIQHNGTSIIVQQRGYNGTTAAAHASGAVVNAIRHAWFQQAWPVYHGLSSDPDWELDMPDAIYLPFHRNRPAQTFTGVKAPAGITKGSDSDGQLELVQPDGTYFDVFTAQIDAVNHKITCQAAAWATGNMIDDPGAGTTSNNDGTRAANFAVGIGIDTGYDLTNGRNSAVGPTTLTDSGTAWNGNAWETDCFVGYRVRSGTTQGACDIYADITANTGTQLTFSAGWKKIADDTAAATPPTGAAYWITNATYTMEHALVIALGNGLLSNANDAFQAPATAPDNGSHSGPYKCGMRWIIPAGTSKPAGLSVAGELWWNGISRFGIFVGDYAGTVNSLFYLERETVPPITSSSGARAPLFVYWGDGGGGANPDAGPNWDGKADMDKIVPLLRLVTS